MTHMNTLSWTVLQKKTQWSTAAAVPGLLRFRTNSSIYQYCSIQVVITYASASFACVCCEGRMRQTWFGRTRFSPCFVGSVPESVWTSLSGFVLCVVLRLPLTTVAAGRPWAELN